MRDAPPPPIITKLTGGRGQEREHGEQRRVALSIVGGPGPRQTWQLASPAVTIGSSPGNQVVIADPTVSRFHARIEAESRGMRVRDLGSTNGTWLNGLEVEAAWLPDRASIRLGETELSFELTAEFEAFAIHPDPVFGRLRGQSLAMRRLFAALGRIAATDSTVLLLGESGTGKELVAEAVHEHSARAGGPLVVVDCGALPGSLIESELFGHERGAFTGALHARAGAFELAHGGTLFLDEVGELDLVLQPRLLRALESRQVKRLGSGQYRSVDVRVVAATNRDLEKMVTTSDFREDLYHRLAVLTVHIPPLRERGDDVRLLAQAFADELAARDPQRLSPALPPELIASLGTRQWPGNVRELRNFVERALVLSVVESAGTPPDPAAAGDVLTWPYQRARQAVIERFEREYVARALERSGGNVAQAARECEVDRTYLFKLIRRHQLRGE